MQYYYGYEQIFNTTLDKIFSLDIWHISQTYTFDWELGYRLYNKIIAVIFQISNGQIITIINSLVYIVFLKKFISVSNSTHKTLLVLIYVCLGLYQTALNMMPNAIVTFIAFYAFQKLRHNKVLFAILVVILSLFHSSALFYISLCFVDKIRLTKKRVFILFIISFIFLVTFDKLIPYILIIVPQRYQYFFTVINGGFVVKNEQILVYLIHIIIISLILLYLKFTRCKISSIEILNMDSFKIFILESFFYILTIKLSGMSRMAFLFSPYIIILINDLLMKIENKKNKKLIIFLIIFICISQYILRLFFNNIGGTMPYSLFF